MVLSIAFVSNSNAAGFSYRGEIGAIGIVLEDESLYEPFINLDLQYTQGRFRSQIFIAQNIEADPEIKIATFRYSFNDWSDITLGKLALRFGLAPPTSTDFITPISEPILDSTLIRQFKAATLLPDWGASIRLHSNSLFFNYSFFYQDVLIVENRGETFFFSDSFEGDLLEGDLSLEDSEGDMLLSNALNPVVRPILRSLLGTVLPQEASSPSRSSGKIEAHLIGITQIGLNTQWSAEFLSVRPESADRVDFWSASSKSWFGKFNFNTELMVSSNGLDSITLSSSLSLGGWTPFLLHTTLDGSLEGKEITGGVLYRLDKWSFRLAGHRLSGPLFLLGSDEGELDLMTVGISRTF